MSDLGGDTVVLILRNQPVLDDDGVQVRDRFNVAQFQDNRVTKSGCAFEELKSSEINTNVNPARSKGKVFIPWDGDAVSMTQHDAIEFLGRVFELEGPPHPWTDIDGQPDHFLCVCEWNGE